MNYEDFCHWAVILPGLSMIDSHYLILSLLLIVWCILHSVLVSNSVISFVRNKIGKKIRFYRLSFNLFSTITFLPIILYSLSIQDDNIFQWGGYFHIPRMIAILVSLYLFYAGAKHYDGLQFFGIRQIKERSNRKSLTDSGELDMRGILGVVRHPWYTATIIIIWTRDLSFSAIIVNSILTAYLIIGTLLEENKLRLEFGDKYQIYQQNVSMLIPVKWVKSKLIRSGKNSH
jgi:protein-S-isoprenylcysteine O-methyltransferase Ste14